MASKIHAAVDAFIWFDSEAPTETIIGQSVDSVFLARDGWSQLKDFSFGVENPTTIGSATGGAGGGKAEFAEFTITKTTDVASPAFFKNCCTGAHYKNVTIAMRKPPRDPGSVSTGAYLIFRFQTVFTTKIGWSGPGDEGPEEKITFVYGKFEITYRQQNADGGIEKPGITQGWDQISNISFSDPPDSVP
jgi:type VI secretion system secreted protein Hcp